VTNERQQIASSPRGSLLSGWLEACGFVLAISVLNIIYAIANVQGAHVAVFILYSVLFAATALLLSAGPGRDAIRIMATPQSWIVGFANIGMESAYCLALMTIAPAAGSLIARQSIPLAVVLGALLFGRAPTRVAWLGVLIIVLSALLVIATLDLTTQWTGLLYAFTAASLISVRTFATEFHPWNRAARTVKEKLSVTGLVVLVTGLGGLTVIGALSVLVGGGYLERSPLIPAPADFIHAPTLLLAAIVGCTLFTAMSYLQFSAVVKIRTENFLAAGAFMPLVTMLLQMAAGSFGLIPIAPIEPPLVGAMLLAILGVLVLIRWRRDQPAAQKADRAAR
jgi:hypothetical protein